MIPLKIWAVSTFLMFIAFGLHRASKLHEDYDPSGVFEQTVGWALIITFLVAVVSFAATIWTLIP